MTEWQRERWMLAALRRAQGACVVAVVAALVAVGAAVWDVLR
jgi:hypothetical protein